VLEKVGRGVNVGSATGAEVTGETAVNDASTVAIAGAGWDGAPASGRVRLDQAMSRKATNRTERFIIKITPIFYGDGQVGWYFKDVKGKYG
jgi:hypothetical protein